jgi:hypothetical protein
VNELDVVDGHELDVVVQVDGHERRPATVTSSTRSTSTTATSEGLRR